MTLETWLNLEYVPEVQPPSRAEPHPLAHSRERGGSLFHVFDRAVTHRPPGPAIRSPGPGA